MAEVGKRLCVEWVVTGRREDISGRCGACILTMRDLPSHSGPLLVPERGMELVCCLAWEARTDPQSGMFSRKDVALWSVFIVVTHFLEAWIP